MLYVFKARMANQNGLYLDISVLIAEVVLTTVKRELFISLRIGFREFVEHLS